jgi:putative membrane protein
MQKLHMANLEEIKMGKLAQQNGTDRIKSYAQTLVQDHQAADDQVKQLAQQKHVTLSDTPKNPKMQEHEKKMTDRLNSLKGAQFDRAFVDMMSGAHKHLIQMAQGWQSSVQDPDVKNLLGQMMPKLQQHAQMADQLKTPAAQGRAPENR